MKGNGVMKEVLFCLVDDALYVANGGDCFTRQGVIGICASHLSEKHATDSSSDDYRAGDRDLISAIQSREIETYKNDKNRLTSDARAEQEISRDYGGRFVWELLQNADDVMGPAERRSADLIGTKGLGFKSVLEITEAAGNPFRSISFQIFAGRDVGTFETRGYPRRIHHDSRFVFPIPVSQPIKLVGYWRRATALSFVCHSGMEKLGKKPRMPWKDSNRIFFS